MLPSALVNLRFVERFYSHAVMASTNDAARALADLPEKGLFVVQADRQTAGRGRQGNTFFSETEGGLWASIITRLSSLDDHFSHNRALSLALCETSEAIAGLTGTCRIKWPNDIYWGERKLCGILLENHPAAPNAIVLGFGINVAMNEDEFPHKLRPIATSLFIETGKKIARSQLLRGILERYHANLSDAPAKSHDCYSQRLYKIGSIAEIDGVCGIFDGVEIDGRLRLKVGPEVILFHSGTVRFPSIAEQVDENK
jgi:BirA family transcriptional regulator, biotin operon repressor / biotin---[acetyl-CoA-carboxylase] ligase